MYVQIQHPPKIDVSENDVQVIGEASMILIRLIVWYSPIGVVFLVAAEILEMQDLINCSPVLDFIYSLFFCMSSSGNI